MAERKERETEREIKGGGRKNKKRKNLVCFLAIINKIEDDKINNKIEEGQKLAP